MTHRSECGQEMCPNWAGDGGCPCRVLGIERAPKPVCPECAQGKHAGCSHLGGVDEFDDIIDCACGCEPSRTCPNCQDVVPVGWTLDDHMNCNWPEDVESRVTSTVTSDSSEMHSDGASPISEPSHSAQVYADGMPGLNEGSGS